MDFHGFPLPIVNEYITVVSADGEVLKDLSIYDIVLDRLPTRLAADIYTLFIRKQKGWRLLLELLRADDPEWDGARQTPLSPFHANSIQVTEGEGHFPPGSLVFCVRNMDLILVTDADMQEVLFDWGPGEIQRPHHPTLLDTGTILLYDNGPLRGYTRVLEVDPRTGGIVWKYTGGARGVVLLPHQGGVRAAAQRQHAHHQQQQRAGVRGDPRRRVRPGSTSTPKPWKTTAPPSTAWTASKTPPDTRSCPAWPSSRRPTSGWQRAAAMR